MEGNIENYENLLSSSTVILTQTTIGRALLETLNEALEAGVITATLATTMKTIYEKSMWDTIKAKSKLRVVIHGSRLVGSRHIEGQWTLIKKNVSIKIGYRRPFSIEKLKIIAIPRRNSREDNDTFMLMEE